MKLWFFAPKLLNFIFPLRISKILILNFRAKITILKLGKEKKYLNFHAINSKKILIWNSTLKIQIIEFLDFSPWFWIYFCPRFFPGILGLENVFAKPLEWHLQVIAHIVQVHEVPNHLGGKSGTPVLLGFWHHWESLERMILCNWATTKLHLDSWNELKKGENYNLNFCAKKLIAIKFVKFFKKNI